MVRIRFSHATVSFKRLIIVKSGIMFDSKDNSLEIITPDLVHTIEDSDTIYVYIDEGILKYITIKSV
jgi:hypothetical protein